ncbi:penicillin-binding protein 2 [Thiohalobacter sp. IOR34]|uniref:penicillin-binding protein 2 n=1 Tax=Thiohalobacter sp. IOR34 TaxID=3057176 RepID=UPI0025B1CA31|nr:penicillin-binding protein 2 [Thiohalobacter sp. IOR34]WJW75931.1 penicillin-binding protein 2 [Thiohalobacter sp. IOR34]
MARRITIKDNLLESRLFMRRAIAALLGAALLLMALVGRLVYLQVVAHEHYRTLSEHNRIKLEPIPPNRGLIFDRNGVLLAENLPSYRLEVIPEQVADMDTTLQQLGELVEIRPYDLERFEKARRRMHAFEGVPLRLHLSDDEVARFASNRHRFPGIEIRAGLSRHYPLGREAAHVIGYVGRINEQDLQTLDEANYRGTTHTGKVGIEKTYEDVLHGTVGYREVETNAQGRTLRVLERQPPVPGSNLYLTLDARLQQAAEAAFGDYNGSAVAIDPRNGAVLALVSLPNYDPNPFVKGIEYRDYQALQSDPDRPLFNRALRGQYPPGSTLKPFIGLAGLELGVTTSHSHTFCPGYYSLPGQEHKYRDWKRGGHGTVDLLGAISQSCDVYFYDLARSLGIDRMHDFLAQFGFGAKTGIDIVGELGGLLPSSAWKRRTRNEPWFPGETLISGIGQGFNLATPLQLAVATAALGSYGKLYRPHVVRALQPPADGSLQPVHLDPPRQIPIHERHNWETAIDAMIEVVHGRRGTARRIGQGIDYRIAGKTGTAQVFGLAQEEKYDAEKIAKRLHDHALFVAFAPADEPRLAVAVVVENGGSGAAVAAPIARRIFDAYFGEGQADGTD